MPRKDSQTPWWIKHFKDVCYAVGLLFLGGMHYQGIVSKIDTLAIKQESFDTRLRDVEMSLPRNNNHPTQRAYNGEAIMPEPQVLRSKKGPIYVN